MIEIDPITRRANPGERRVHGVLDRGDERHDGAVVRRIGRHVEHGDASNGGNGVTDRRDYVSATTLGKIGDEFYETHEAKSEGRRELAAKLTKYADDKLRRSHTA
jgi:hypothetical protein